MTEIIVEFPSKLTVKEKEMIYGYKGELVRCKDCKHSELWYSDRRRCFLWCETGNSVWDDGYCSYGERSEE